MTTEPLGLHANQWRFLETPNALERYVEARASTDRDRVRETTQRQFLTARDILARLNGSHGLQARRGALLADDVGLGKTTVAVLVAWIFASAGKRVRILAPNEVMARRWTEELHAHVPLLRKCAPQLAVDVHRVKGRCRLDAGRIQVAKHSYASDGGNLACDLLIVDEAHRAKGEGSAFSRSLREKTGKTRVLILTATPFSINLAELRRMLKLVGGESASSPVRKFSDALDTLYSGSTARNPADAAARLAEKAESAIGALRECVIRHSVDDLPGERDAFGTAAGWEIPVPPASATEIELMLRLDRALRVAKNHDIGPENATNDPRFHVGWRHFDIVCTKLRRNVQTLPESSRAVVDHQLGAIGQLRRKDDAHTKMVAVAEAVRGVVEQGEKVVLFCHHHATAQELTAHLAATLPAKIFARAPAAAAWEAAWETLIRNIGTAEAPIRSEPRLRANFVAWLCADLIREQIWAWLCRASEPPEDLFVALRQARPRRADAHETIAEAAQRLYRTLIESPSSKRILLEPGDDLKRLPGGNGALQVLGVCEPSDNPLEEALFLHNRQPDTIISVFNSPFGPDVLVVTDRLSEGIDLHRYCRHLIHYELDPSPIRTVQRNGRLRRVNSWAAVTGQPILIAYPAFRGTRDHRLVQIMKKRIGSFSLLLGGVRDIEFDEATSADEDWRNRVVSIARARLERAGGQLCAKNPRDKG